MKTAEDFAIAVRTQEVRGVDKIGKAREEEV